MQSATERYGSITWWGFTPTLDLISHYAREPAKERADQDPEKSDCVNILLVGCGDLRHVMMTLAGTYRQEVVKIHFYVMEGNLEVFARHMLFLSLFMERPDQLGLQEKVELFLELYGNTLVRASTATYLKETAASLIKGVTDLDYLKLNIPLLDISPLKFKERDFLEGIFKFWRHQDGSSFEIHKHWEGRLRHSLGARYDSRNGVFDWDYHMKLHDLTPVVAAKEYIDWRETGVAFQLRDDAPYEHTNCSLTSGVSVTQSGEHVARRGYWGDMVNSPYLTFGIESENKEILKSPVGAHATKSSMHVSEYNLLSLVHQLTTGRQYTTSTTSHELSPDHSKAEETTTGPLFNNSCQITFLPLNSASTIGKKAKFRNLFNIAYFSNSMVHHLVSGVEKSFAPDCTLVLETANFMLDLTKEQKAEYVEKIMAMASTIGFTVPVCTESTTDQLVFTHPPSN